MNKPHPISMPEINELQPPVQVFYGAPALQDLGTTSTALVPTSIRKNFKHLPDIEQFSILPEQPEYERMRDHIKRNGIQSPILIWERKRATSDGQSIKDYVVLDGFVRLRIAEELHLPIVQIPWYRVDGIADIEAAMTYAVIAKVHRTHLNRLERAYVIGQRYLMEKRGVGAPEGSHNNAAWVAALKQQVEADESHRPVADPEDERHDGDSSVFLDANKLDHQEEVKGARHAPLTLADFDLTSQTKESFKTAQRLSRELGIGIRAIYKYAVIAFNMEIVAKDIARLWKLPIEKALRCCTRTTLCRVDPSDPNVIDKTKMTLLDWQRLDPKTLEGAIDQHFSASSASESPDELRGYYQEGREGEAQDALRRMMGDVRFHRRTPRQEFDPSLTISEEEGKRLRQERVAAVYDLYYHGNAAERASALAAIRGVGLPLPDGETATLLDEQREQKRSWTPTMTPERREEERAIGDNWDDLVGIFQLWQQQESTALQAIQEMIRLAKVLGQKIDRRLELADQGNPIREPIDHRQDKLKAGLFAIANLQVNLSTKRQLAFPGQDGLWEELRNSLIPVVDSARNAMPHTFGNVRDMKGYLGR